MTRSGKVTRIILALLAITIGSLLIYGPIPQWDSYHHFADERMLWGNIPNTWNVLSNIAFGIVAFYIAYMWGPLTRRRMRINTIDDISDAPLWVFIIGVIGVGLGSSHYHSTPSNETLIWDRLPMTIAFAAVYAEFLSQYVSEILGRRVLWILLVFGLASISVWQELNDLRLYGIAQYFPLATIPLIAAIVGVEARGSLKKWCAYLWHPKEKSTALWRNVFLFYVLAKVFEYFDVGIFTHTGGTISGHTLKHIVSGIACIEATRAMIRRRIPK